MSIYTEEIRLYAFGPFRLDAAEKLLLKNDEPVPLTPKAFETLLILVQKNGSLVQKDELVAQLWPDSFVEENSLAQNIYLLRKALGEGPGEHAYIETVPRRGYRFIAKVTRLREDDEAPAIESKAPVGAGFEEEAGREVASEIDPGPTARAVINRSRMLAPSLLALVALAALAAASYLLLQKVAGPPLETKPKAIAVLPFKSLGGGGNDELLGLGITDAMITKFSNLQQISVRPTSSIFKYTAAAYDPSTAGRELGVDAVLEGTVQRVNDRVRVTVQLINVRDGEPLWADRFDEKFTSVFAVQDSISEQVAQALELKLNSDERRQLVKRYTENAEAYQAYVRGVFFWNKRTDGGLSRSIEYFKQAIEKDPEYALAYAGLADSYALVGYLEYGLLPPREAYEHARAAAMKALELDESIAEAHSALAIVKAYRDGDWPGAELANKRAIALKANHPTVHHRYSIYLRDQGRLDEALEEIELAHKLDPLSPVIGSNLAYVLYLRRDYDRAAESCRKVLETEPEYFQSLIALGMIYEQKKMYGEAIELLGRVREQTRGRGGVYYYALEALAHAQAAAGNRDEAQKLLTEMTRVSEQKKDNVEFNKAMILAGLGEVNKAFELLERDAGNWISPPPTLALDPRFDNLRVDSRYQKLMHRRFGSGVSGQGPGASEDKRLPL
ncbi:MAG TPA: winged helix-turn-helix domain-containing protein [Blastocatellia bacterium]|nr:winged helix-turn-helix domain-containing protein [Blastocatellia bacterium]